MVSDRGLRSLAPFSYLVSLAEADYLGVRLLEAKLLCSAPVQWVEAFPPELEPRRLWEYVSLSRPYLQICTCSLSKEAKGSWRTSSTLGRYRLIQHLTPCLTQTIRPIKARSFMTTEEEHSGQGPRAAKPGPSLHNPRLLFPLVITERWT